MKTPILKLRAWLAGGLLAGLLAAPLAAQAATAPERRPENRPAVGENLARLRQHLRKIAEDLELTDAQIHALKAIFARERLAYRELREDDTLTPREKLAEARDIRRHAVDAIQIVLTPEQWAIWRELREDQLELLRERISRG